MNLPRAKGGKLVKTTFYKDSEESFVAWDKGVIDSAHTEIHGGEHYFLEGTATLASGGTMAFGITTPDTTDWAHMLFELDSNGQLSFDLYEDGTWIIGVTETPMNNNRNSANTSGLLIVSNPDFIEGTLIASGQWGDKKFGGAADREYELILRQNTDYVWQFNSGVASNLILYDLSYYEHRGEN